MREKSGNLVFEQNKRDKVEKEKEAESIMQAWSVKAYQLLPYKDSIVPQLPNLNCISINFAEDMQKL